MSPTDSEVFCLSSEQVHIWSFQHQKEVANKQLFFSWLSADETKKASQYASPELQERFGLSRGFLRALLSCYLRTEPKELQFSYGHFGKPQIVQPEGVPKCTFSLTHSGALTLCAVTLEREIGLDVEQMRFVPDMTEIAENFFSAQESAALRALPPAQQQQSFFRCWTAKEAFAKATGEGLSRAMSSFVVSFSPPESLSIVSIEGSSKRAGEWRLCELQPAEGFQGTLAIKPRGCIDLSMHDWSKLEILLAPPFDFVPG